MTRTECSIAAEELLAGDTLVIGMTNAHRRVSRIEERHDGRLVVSFGGGSTVLLPTAAVRVIR